ncbi:hypothetical protein [Streptomyces sp. NPDC005336]|uniref:hypothetical protein n=1 Tax=unclassified Streptomyces TaxID=2593676 RepID=UPI0033BC26C7
MCRAPLGDDSGRIDNPSVTREITMFHYELHRIREAELLRQAEHHRLVREARGDEDGRSAAHASGGRVKLRRWRDGHRSPRSYDTAA